MRRIVNSVDEPGSLTDKQKAALDKYGLPYNDETTSREGALAMARYHRELKKDRPKRRRHKRRRGSRKSLEDFAKELNKNLPKSEQWFRKLYEPYKVDGDQFNVPFCGYIPDVLNKQHRYIIEIDGSFHNKPHIQLKDRKKDQQRKLLGYMCIRIKAYDEAQFKAAMKRINARRYEGAGLPVTRLSEEEYRRRLEEARSTKREGESE